MKRPTIEELEKMLSQPNPPCITIMPNGEVRVSLDGAALIALERQRQVDKEGWTPEHDDGHSHNEMAVAAMGYTSKASNVEARVKTFGEPRCHCGARGLADCTCVILTPDAKWIFPWPWEKKWWKPSGDPIRNLVKAGALIAAEIDRLQRLQNLTQTHNPVLPAKPTGAKNP